MILFGVSLFNQSLKFTHMLIVPKILVLKLHEIQISDIMYMCLLVNKCTGDFIF
jgi:hypothetical protein